VASLRTTIPYAGQSDSAPRTEGSRPHASCYCRGRAGGHYCRRHLRKLDPNAQITVLGDEPEPPYSRMVLPYYLIDRIDEKGTYLRKGNAYFGSKILLFIRKKGTDQNRGIYLYKRKGHLPRAGVLRELENLKSIEN
jgi:hypothetical protein